MLQHKITIKDPIGIHARPAALLVKELKPFESDFKLIKDEKEASAKSLLQIMGLGAKQGDEIKVVADGPDEDEMMDAFLAFAEENL